MHIDLLMNGLRSKGHVAVGCLDMSVSRLWRTKDLILLKVISNIELKSKRFDSM